MSIPSPQFAHYKSFLSELGTQVELVNGPNALLLGLIFRVGIDERPKAIADMMTAPTPKL